MFRKIKRTIFFSIFCFMLAALLFPDHILIAGLKWQIKRYFQKNLQAKISFEKVELKQGKIHFEGGKVSKQKELEATFSAILSPRLNLKKREIGGKLTLDNLKITRCKSGKASFPYFKRSLNRFFSLDLKTTIPNAEVSLYDLDNDPCQCRQFYFDLTQYLSSGNAFGEILVYKDPLAEGLSSFFFQAQGNNLEVKGEFASEFFPDIYGVATYFFDVGQPLQGWEFVSGRINGKMRLNFEKGIPTSLQADVVLTDMQGDNPGLEILAGAQKLQAVLDTDLTKVSGINGDFLIQGGKLALQDRPEVCVGFWDLSDLHSKVSIKKGKLESSRLQANFLGLKGQFVLDAESEDLIHMDFKGMSKEMVSFFPLGFQKGFQKAFPNDFFELNATVKKAKAGLELCGFLTTTDDEKKKSHFDFGCHLGKVEKTFEPMGLTALPFSLSRSMSTFLENVKAQFCLTSKRLGWFRAKGISLNKFLSPFLFKDVNMQVFASVDIDATFDERYLVLFYEGEKFHLDSPNFTLKADSIQKKEENVTAVHCIDLSNFSHVGFLPLERASYFQKNYGLLIENAEALVHFENNSIKVKQIKTNWNNLGFQGNIDIRVKSPEDVDLEIVSESFFGSAKSGMSFVSHFVPLKIWQVPVEQGEVEGFFNFKYHFSPKAELKEGIVRGKLKNVSSSQKLFCFQESEGDFEYDFSKNSLVFNDCKGKLNLPFKNKAYICNLSKCHLRDFPFFQGEFTLELEDKGKETLKFQGSSCEKDQGREICILGNDCSFTAFQLGNLLKIDDFSYGQTKGEGVLKFHPHAIEIERLTCRKDFAKEVVFSGLFDLRKLELIADVEKIEVDLNEAFKRVLNFKHVGQLAAKGSLNWQIGRNIEAVATVSYKDLELGEIPFGSGGNLRCSYSSKLGLEVEGLELVIPIKEGTQKCNLGKIFYNFDEKKIELEGFNFSFSKEKMEAFVKTIEKICRDKIPPSLLELLKNAKKEDPIEGKISAQIYPENFWISLSLKDGLYHLADKCVELKNFSLIYDPFKINVWSLCRYQNARCWIHFLSDSSSLKEGLLSICDKEIKQNEVESKEHAIVVGWERNPDKGLNIRSIEGRFAGLEIDLKPSRKNQNPDWIFLQGKVDLELQEVTPFLWGAAKEFVSSYALNGFYNFEGEVGFHKKEMIPHFSCLLTGKEIAFAGVQMADFSSHVDYRNASLDFTDFSIEDSAGRVSIDQIHLNRNQDAWQFEMEEAKLQNVRFSRLRCPWLKYDQKKKTFFRFLCIPFLALNKLTGTLGKTETLKGFGKLEFTNVPKKNLFSTLLFLPTEITARIGLDLSNLVPVRGTVVYEIKDSKINFLELKDMFSDGKRSRFYLAEQTPAWVDFYGNLNMKIKMKQYNLLMKLAEFFTISVKGTLFKPAYTFSNHLDDDDAI